MKLLIFCETWKQNLYIKTQKRRPCRERLTASSYYRDVILTVC